MEDISNIQRILLNMKYDSKHTLTENYNRVLLNEEYTIKQDSYWEPLKTVFTSRMKGGDIALNVSLKDGGDYAWWGPYVIYKNNPNRYLAFYKGSSKECHYTMNDSTDAGKLYAGQGDSTKLCGYGGGSFGCPKSTTSCLTFKDWMVGTANLYKTDFPENAVKNSTYNQQQTSSGGGGGTDTVGTNIAPGGSDGADHYWKALKKRLIEWGIPENGLKIASDKKLGKPAYYIGMFIFYADGGPGGIATYSTSQGGIVYAQITKPYAGQTLEATNITSTGYDGTTNLKAWLDWYNDISIKQYGTSIKGSSGKISGKDSGIQNNPAKTSTPTTPAQKVEVKPCSGTFKQGCKDGGGDTTIAKVQKCLLDKGMYKTKSGKPARVDGDFGSGTLAGIKQLLGKDTFTAEEVDTKICGPGGQTPGGQTPGVSSGGGGQDTNPQSSDSRETVGGQ